MKSLGQYRYRVVDVFTERPLEGNALAVFPDASGLDGATMQKIARELNLSETTFVGPATRADCAVQVRIFTPTLELSFAGHPTIGTSFVLLEEGIISADGGRFALEEKIGPVAVRVESGPRPLIWLTTPSINYGPTFDRELCARVLGLEPKDLLEITPQLVSAGNPTLFVAVKDPETVDRAGFDLSGMARLKAAEQDPMCVFVFAPTPTGAYSRMFAPEYGVVEDPATGSSTGPLAAFMLRHQLIAGDEGARFVSEQGTKMGRRSLLHILLHGPQGREGIEVGGSVAPVAEATMKL
ncbi:MAG TPA: PhzF family phenazine biosynthesis protein [Blastocatellia bacterium]|nr:PhzF family phenazine biosynthesis protein [Blastocatellia bacterium]